MRTSRYVTLDVLLHTAAVAFVLFLVVFSGRFIRYLAEAAIGDLSAGILVPIMLYKLPAFFELILPLGFYIGVLLSFSRFYADNEMIILRASGTSQWQLLQRIIAAVVTVTGLVGLLSLYLGPAGAARANALLAEPKSAEGMHVLAEGRFKKQRGGDYVTYVESIDDAGAMKTVFIAERQASESGTIIVTTLARAGAIEVDPSSSRRYLTLSEGYRYSMSPGSAGLRQAKFGAYRSLIPEVEGGLRAQAKVETLPTMTLFDSGEFEHRSVLGWRVSLPLMVPILALFAIPLSRTDARSGRYAKLGPALIVCLLYFIVLLQARTAAEETGSYLGFALGHVIFATLGVVLMASDDIKHWRRWGVRDAT